MNTNDAAGASALIMAEKLAQLGSAPFLETVLPRALAAFVVYAGLLVLLRLGRSRPLVSRFSLTLNLLGLSCILQLFLGACIGALFPIVPRLFLAAVVFFLILLVLRIIEVGLFEFLFIRQGRKPVPVVLRDIARSVLTALILVAIIKGFFPQVNFNVLAVSSLVIGFVLANATQDTLGSLVSGLALNAENSFSIGDWICVGDRIGKVTDITWRSTRLCTRNMEDLIVPNATLSKETLINFSRPTPELRIRIPIGISYDIPPNKVREVVLETVREIAGIDPVPVPKVRLVEYGDSAILYHVLFYIHDYEKMEDIRGELMNLLWYRFKRADISIPFPIRDVRMRQVSREDDRRAEEARTEDMAGLFAKVDLFAPLSDTERRQLASGCQLQLFAAREDVVRQGDPGHSLFFIKSGKVGVYLDQKDRKRVCLCELGPGQFFGERSLLTGENRSATVSAVTDAALVELGKEAFRNVLQEKPDMAEYLGKLLASRDRDREERAAGAGAATPGEQEKQKSRQFMSKILTFFGIS
jgi:small-conductance mechanosensitive channel/CRP-like cAMP-binding protein